MKQQDIHVGLEYVIHDASSYTAEETAARLLVLAEPARGRVRVRVLEPATRPGWRHDPLLSTAGSELNVATRDVVAPWSDWAAGAPQREAAKRDSERRRQADRDEEVERVRLDPARALPPRYDPAYGWEREDLAEASGTSSVDAGDKVRAAYIAAADLGPRITTGEIVPLFNGLPALLRRDVLAVLTVRRRRGGAAEAAASGGIAQVLGRGVAALEGARIALHGVGAELQPGRVFTAVEVDFVAALRAEAVAAGGALGVPSSPPMPDWVERSALIDELGWVRVGVVPTTGEKLHGNGCNSLKGHTADPEDHLPWWQVALAPDWKVCGVCAGPELRDPIEAAHLILAASVWDARGRGVIETWQRVAMARLAAATLVANATKAEPEHTAAAQMVEHLVRSPLGPEGEDALRWLAGFDMGSNPGPLTKEQARALSAERLNLAAAHLPGLASLPALPRDASRRQQQERLSAIGKQSQIPEVDRLLFPWPPH